MLLATLAKETINAKYPFHLQVFTDGSILPSGETGCALTIPGLNITRKYKLNRGISIFSAELYAIYMACSLINDLPNPPFGAVILTDSKSSLQALASGTKNRAGMQAEIQFLAHQIMLKGTDFALMWLPSHTGIRGNELADKAAKEAALSDLPVIDIRLSCREAKDLLAKQKREEREQSLSDTCAERGWARLPYSRKGHHLPLPLRTMRLLRRIRTVSSRIYWDEVFCQCGKPGHFTHIFEGCAALRDEMAELVRYRAENGLSTADFLLPHSSLGIEPMVRLATTLSRSSVVSWF